MTIVARKLSYNPFSFDSKRIVLSVRVTINAFIDVFQKGCGFFEKASNSESFLSTWMRSLNN